MPRTLLHKNCIGLLYTYPDFIMFFLYLPITSFCSSSTLTLLRPTYRATKHIYICSPRIIWFYVILERSLYTWTLQWRSLYTLSRAHPKCGPLSHPISMCRWKRIAPQVVPMRGIDGPLCHLAKRERMPLMRRLQICAITRCPKAIDIFRNIHSYRYCPLLLLRLVFF